MFAASSGPGDTYTLAGSSVWHNAREQKKSEELTFLGTMTWCEGKPPANTGDKSVASALFHRETHLVSITTELPSRYKWTLQPVT